MRAAWCANARTVDELNAKARAAGKSTRYALNSSYADMTQAEFAAAILRAGVGLRKFFNNSEEHKDFYSYGQRGHATHAAGANASAPDGSANASSAHGENSNANDCNSEHLTVGCQSPSEVPNWSGDCPAGLRFKDDDGGDDDVCGYTLATLGYDLDAIARAHAGVVDQLEGAALER